MEKFKEVIESVNSLNSIDSLQKIGGSLYCRGMEFIPLASNNENNMDNYREFYKELMKELHMLDITSQM